MLPWRCVLCGSKSDQCRDLCRICEASMPWCAHAPTCQTCGMALEVSAPLCGQCLKSPPIFDRLISLWRYNSLSQYFVQQLKFNEKLIYARLIAELMVEHVPLYYREQPWPEVLIAVPLHRRRLFTRGFNQALEIARILAKSLRIPCHADLCKRVRHTQAQALLTGHDRHRNLKGAFVAQKMPYRHVAIIDDVVTTMSTVNELARALQKVGVEKIEVWSAVRASLH